MLMALDRVEMLDELESNDSHGAVCRTLPIRVTHGVIFLISREFPILTYNSRSRVIMRDLDSIPRLNFNVFIDLDS